MQLISQFDPVRLPVPRPFCCSGAFHCNPKAERTFFSAPISIAFPWLFFLSL